jgi:hypothetical protein
VSDFHILQAVMVEIHKVIQTALHDSMYGYLGIFDFYRLQERSGFSRCPKVSGR